MTLRSSDRVWESRWNAYTWIWLTKGSVFKIIILGTFTKFRKATVSFVVFVRLSLFLSLSLSLCLFAFHPSVRPSAWNNSVSTEWIFVKFDVWLFFGKSIEKIQFHYFRRNIVTKIKCVSREDQYIVLIMSGSLLLRMRNVSDKRCRENQSTHSISQKKLFLKSCRL